MSTVLSVVSTLSWVAGGFLLATSVTLGLALHRRKLPVHERPKRRRR